MNRKKIEFRKYFALPCQSFSLHIPLHFRSNLVCQHFPGRSGNRWKRSSRDRTGQGQQHGVVGNAFRPVIFSWSTSSFKSHYFQRPSDHFLYFNCQVGGHIRHFSLYENFSVSLLRPLKTMQRCHVSIAISDRTTVESLLDKTK